MEAEICYKDILRHELGWWTIGIMFCSYKHQYLFLFLVNYYRCVKSLTHIHTWLASASNGLGSRVWSEPVTAEGNAGCPLLVVVGVDNYFDPARCGACKKPSGGARRRWRRDRTSHRCHRHQCFFKHYFLSPNEEQGGAASQGKSHSAVAEVLLHGTASFVRL